MSTIYETALTIACGLSLIPYTIMDIKKTSISVRLLIGGLVVSAAVAVYLTAMGEKSTSDLFLSFMPGTFLLLTSGLSRGQIGAGDGIVFVMMGLLIGCRKAFMVLFLALLLSAIYSMYLLLSEKADRNHAIAWMPFVLAGYFLWMMLEVFMGGSGI